MNANEKRIIVYAETSDGSRHAIRIIPYSDHAFREEMQTAAMHNRSRIAGYGGTRIVVHVDGA